MRTNDAVIAEKINRAVCHQRNVDSNCISLLNIRFMEHFCNSNQSFHVFIPTGFANGKKLHFHGMLESCSCDWKSRNILWSGIGTTKSAAQHYLSANRFNPHSCIAIDCSCIWQIKRALHNGHNTLSLFLWLKMGRGANVPDETHHSDVNILSFFGLRVLRFALKSQDAVTQVELRSEQCMQLVPHMIWLVFCGSGHCYWSWMSCIATAEFLKTNSKKSEILKFETTGNKLWLIQKKS